MEICANKSSPRRANAHFYCVSCGFLPTIHALELAFLGIPLLSFSFLVPLSRFTSHESGLFSFRVAPLTRQSLIRFEGIENLSSCLTGGCRNCLVRNTKRGKRLPRFLCQVPSDLNFLLSRDDCFAALLKSSCHSALGWQFHRNRPTIAATVAGVARL